MHMVAQETLQEAQEKNLEVTVYTKSGHIFKGKVISWKKQKCVLEVTHTSSSHGETKTSRPTLDLIDSEVVEPWA